MKKRVPERDALNFCMTDQPVGNSVCYSYSSSSARIMLSSRLENIWKPSFVHSARISRFSGSMFETTLLSFSSRANWISRR